MQQPWQCCPVSRTAQNPQGTSHTLTPVRTGHALTSLWETQASGCAHAIAFVYVLHPQARLPPPLQLWIHRVSSATGLRKDALFTAEQLAKYTSGNPAADGKIYMAIMGEVFDVSSKPNFYGV